jgi:excisionase family DNA binding protein
MTLMVTTATHPMLKVADVAERLNVSPNTVYRLADTGRIPACTIGTQLRFDPTDFEAWLLNQRQRGRA